MVAKKKPDKKMPAMGPDGTVPPEGVDITLAEIKASIRENIVEDEEVAA